MTHNVFHVVCTMPPAHLTPIPAPVPMASSTRVNASMRLFNSRWTLSRFPVVGYFFTITFIGGVCSLSVVHLVLTRCLRHLKQSAG